MIQPRSNLICLGKPPCNLDLPINQKHRKKSKGSSIKGKKITSAAQVQVSNRDKTPPNRIIAKKVQEKPSPSKSTKTSENPGTLKKYSKVINSDKATSKTCKKSQVSKLKSSKPISKTSELNHEDKSPPNPSLLKPKLHTVIKSSLKKPKLHKLTKEKLQKTQNNKKEQKKFDRHLQNLQISIKNKKWKKVQLNWAIDKTRLVLREHSSERPTSRKAKSTERVRPNEQTKETFTEQGRSFVHNRTLSHGSDSTSHVRSKFRDLRVAEFMKAKQSELKQQQELESLHKLAPSSRKQNDLQKLQVLREALRGRGLKKKGKKAKATSKSKDSSRAYCQSKGRRKEMNLVYEPYKLVDSSAESSARLGKRTDRSGLQTSRGKMDRRTLAAVKIQSHVRRFLAQRRILIRMQSSRSADKIVKEILTRRRGSDCSELEGYEEKALRRNSGKKVLEIMIQSCNSSRFSDLIQDEDLQGSAKLQKEEKVENKGKILTVETQLQTLENLKEKEIQDMKKIAVSAGIDLKVGQMFSEVMMKRYSQLMSLLEGSVNEAKHEILSEMTEDQQPALFPEIQENKSKTTSLHEASYKAQSTVTKVPEIRPAHIITSKSLLNPEDSQNPVDTPQFSAILSPQSRHSSFHDYSIQSLSPRVQQIKAKSCNLPNDHLNQDSSINLSSEFSIQKSESSLHTCQVWQNVSVLQDTSFELSSSLPDPGPDPGPAPGPVPVSGLCDKSHSPDYYVPDRPSAPLNYIDCSSQSSDTNPSPSVSQINSGQFDDSSCVEWTANRQLEVSPELVSQLAEDILMGIIGEHEVFNSQNWDVLRIRTDSEAILNYSKNIYKICDIDQVLEAVKVPAECDGISVLKYVSEGLDYMAKPLFCEILDLDVYLELEYQLDLVKKPERPAFVSEDAYAWLIEAEHIHNKAIFDANNEALTKFRPKSLDLAPWGFCMRRRLAGIDEGVLQRALNLVAIWSQYQVGKIFNSDLISSSQLIDDEMFQQIRDDNLSKMLLQETIEDESLWLDYSFEDLQTKLDLADNVVEFLSQELVNILNNQQQY